MNFKQIATYYFVLLLFMVLWTSRIAAPPALLRSLFFIAVVLPGTHDRHGLFLAAILYFWTVSVYGYAYSFMPTMTEFYLGAILVTIIFYRYKAHYTSFGSINLLIPLLLIKIISNNLVEDSLVDNLVYTLLLFLLSHFIFPDINHLTIKYFQLSFMAITIVLSITFLTMSDLFAIPDEMGTIGWNDQNYMGMIIGIGASIGVANCLRAKEQSRPMLIISIASISLAMTAMLLLASRGAILCFVLSAGLLLINSTGNKQLKALIVFSAAIFLYYLYTNEYFDMLEKRFELEDGTGSQRSVIWSAKWAEFIKRDNVFDLFMGVGRHTGLSFGSTPRLLMLGFHNDFLAFLVSYGIIGFTLFITILTHPLRHIRRHSPYRDMVIANTAFLFISCFTLEPFYLGYFPFYAFLMYTMFLSRMKVAADNPARTVKKIENRR